MPFGLLVLDAQEQLTLWSLVRSGRIWNSSKLSCMSSLPASMKWIRSRTAEKKWQHRFSYYKLWVIFFRRSRPANSAVGCPIWLNFEVLRAPMHAIITCKYKKNWMKKKLRKSGNTVFSIINLWELSVAMETRVLIRSGPKALVAFPPS